MERLLKDKQMQENVRNRRDWYIKEYSWDTVAKRVIKVIKNSNGL
jgi:glycosyltransferase involved in cell wall biosynthesis